MKYEFLFDNLSNIREDHDLNQEFIANILGISQANYARWENKTKIIPLKRLNDYCNYFGLNMDYVVGLTNIRKNMTNNNILNRKIIGNNLRNFRIKNNLSLRKLADILNTTHSTLCAYESGKTLILTAFLIEICLKYNISMDEFCNRK